MSENTAITIEILNGPLDGQRIALTQDTQWTRSGPGPLSFSWDAGLGEPQAVFHYTNQGWMVEVLPSPHGLYVQFHGESRRFTGGVFDLQPGMLLRASASWLLVVG